MSQTKNLELKNIFPKPSEVCEDTDKEIKDLIRAEIQSKGKIQFYDMLKFFDNAIENKNFKKANIAAYYCTNAVLGNPNMSGDNKAEIILSLRARIEMMMGRNPNDVFISGK